MSPEARTAAPSAAKPAAATSARKPLLIFGAGGHGRVVADAALLQAAWSVVTASDRDPARCRGELLPGIALQPVAVPSGADVHIAIGGNQAREKEAREALAAGGATLVSVIHPAARVSPFCAIAPGCFVAAGAVLAPGVDLDAGVIVNHGAVVDHDTHIGAFTHIAPNATLGGGVAIGQRVLVGAGAIVLPLVTIGDDITVGAGSVVRTHLTEAGTYVGVPARRIR
ncbi:MAG: acetyltransferase [Comamonadaceae bacterium]|nr:MAG: acetyltransferase [Comamonadaceae bacterium]